MPLHACLQSSIVLYSALVCFDTELVRADDRNEQARDASMLAIEEKIVLRKKNVFADSVTNDMNLWSPDIDFVCVQLCGCCAPARVIDIVVI